MIYDSIEAYRIFQKELESHLKKLFPSQQDSIEVKVGSPPASLAP